MPVVNLGQITRSQMIEAASDVDNSASPIDFNGYLHGIFDAGCNGAPIWELLPMQRVTVKAGDIVSISAGGQCGDMPLGDRNFTLTLYQDDMATIVDQYIVNFTLTE